jgi:hypothetical protein
VFHCIFCDEGLNAKTKPEHILLSALGGRKTTTRVICSSCNGAFGSTIDKSVADQVAILRNMLQLDSGTGKSPPMLRKVKAGSETINIKGDGTLELEAKPFTITPLGDGNFQLNVTARSIEEVAEYVPHIAAQLKCSEEQVLQYLASATATSVSKRPDIVYFEMSFGGGVGIRSFAKSCLVLWATLVGNNEVKSAVYEAVRTFIIHDDDRFARDRVHLDSRFLPQVEELKRRFGDFFNLIYIQSDEAGRVIGHFTLYNVVAWQFVLAESGGTPNLKIGLISNPMNLATWSDTIADESDLDFSWLNSPDYSYVHARQRLGATVERAQKEAMSRELERIVRSVFKKHGIVGDAVVADPEILKKIIGEISQRAASHIMDIPHEETVTGDDLFAKLRAALHKHYE